MMTDAMKPLGISVLKNVVPVSTQYFWNAGGRLYVDLSELLRHKIGRKIFPLLLNNIDEAASRAIREISKRSDFLAVRGKGGALKVIRAVMPVVNEVRKKPFYTKSAICKR